MPCVGGDDARKIIFVSSLSTRWYSRFKNDLYAFSYDEIVAVLLEVTQGRRKARTPFEVQIEADLSVRVRASPRLRIAAEADDETLVEVGLLERDLEDRDEAIRRVVAVVAREQRAFFAGDSPEPRKLDLDQLAASTGFPRWIVESCIRNKLVAHPRGVAKLEDLVDPGHGSLPLFAPRPKHPRAPIDAVAALLASVRPSPNR